MFSMPSFRQKYNTKTKHTSLFLSPNRGVAESTPYEIKLYSALELARTSHFREMNL